MDILQDIFDGRKEKESIWLSEDGKPIEENPFYVANETLYDRYDHIRDDILGKVMRGKVVVSDMKVTTLKKGDHYLFFNETGTVKKKLYRNDVLDLFNIVTGNCFNEEPNENDKVRITSIHEALRAMGTNLFPYGINGDHVEIRNRILAITENLKPSTEETMPGVLRESFRKLTK